MEWLALGLLTALTLAALATGSVLLLRLRSRDRDAGRLRDEVHHLEDTSEAGGVWAAERLRTALARKGDSLLRLAAGVAAYPTHALEGDEVLSRARQALDSARSSGSSRVEVASVD